MMNVIMIKNKLASEDGINVKMFKSGESHDVSDAIGEAFIACGAAEKKQSKKSDDKDIKNKALDSGDLQNKQG